MRGMGKRPHRVPELTLGWRLKMALGDMPATDMADALGVSRQTVSRWMADRGAPPRRVYIRAWADLTDTDLTWLLTGELAAVPTPIGFGRWAMFGAPMLR